MRLVCESYINYLDKYVALRKSLNSFSFFFPRAANTGCEAITSWYHSSLYFFYIIYHLWNNVMYVRGASQNIWIFIFTFRVVTFIYTAIPITLVWVSELLGTAVYFVAIPLSQRKCNLQSHVFLLNTVFT